MKQKLEGKGVEISGCEQRGRQVENRKGRAKELKEDEMKKKRASFECVCCLKLKMNSEPICNDSVRTQGTMHIDQS